MNRPALPRSSLLGGGAHQNFHARNHHIEQYGLRRLQGFQRGDLLVAQEWAHRHVLLERIQRPQADGRRRGQIMRAEFSRRDMSPT